MVFKQNSDDYNVRLKPIHFFSFTQMGWFDEFVFLRVWKYFFFLFGLNNCKNPPGANVVVLNIVDFRNFIGCELLC